MFKNLFSKNKPQNKLSLMERCVTNIETFDKTLGNKIYSVKIVFKNSRKTETLNNITQIENNESQFIFHSGNNRRIFDKTIVADVDIKDTTKYENHLGLREVLLKVQMEEDCLWLYNKDKVEVIINNETTYSTAEEWEAAIQKILEHCKRMNRPVFINGNRTLFN